MSGSNQGPTYLLIVGISLFGMIGAMIIFTNSSNTNIPLVLSGIITIIGFAYGLHLGQTNGTLKT